MNESRLRDYLDHMRQAATDACSFVDGLGKADFVEDKRTQQAVIMSLIIIGEAATKVMDGYAEFVQAHPEVPWRSMRGMRNRIAHGYFDINLDVVWETVQAALPELLKQLPSVSRHADDAASADRSGVAEVDTTLAPRQTGSHMLTTIYHNPRCSTSRNALAMIRSAGIEPQVVEYLAHLPDREKLKELISGAGLTVRAAMREKDALFHELGLDDPQLSDEDLLDAVLAHPALLNRPFVQTPLGVRLCRPVERVLEILPSSQQTVRPGEKQAT